jgi:hypothetical protein
MSAGIDENEGKIISASNHGKVASTFSYWHDGIPKPITEECDMTTRPNILVIVTDQEYAHQALPAGFSLPSRDRKGICELYRINDPSPARIPRERAQFL